MTTLCANCSLLIRTRRTFCCSWFIVDKTPEAGDHTRACEQGDDPGPHSPEKEPPEDNEVENPQEVSDLPEVLLPMCAEAFLVGSGGTRAQDWLLAMSSSVQDLEMDFPQTLDDTQLDGSFCFTEPFLAHPSTQGSTQS